MTKRNRPDVKPGDRVRGTHPYCYRSGEWATIAGETRRQADGVPLWLVEFADGATDEWVQDDPAAGYEFLCQTAAAECACGEADCDFFAFDYPWCRPCGEHHRLPECAISTQGQALAPCGHPWTYEHRVGECV
ncbi:hypothetical protein SEA_KIKO_62 [Gordonia phage Kiko]|nr:hypothetical protein SEA_KIKO_62 [Gordonia phage Kiko]